MTLNALYAHANVVFIIKICLWNKLCFHLPIYMICHPNGWSITFIRHTSQKLYTYKNTMCMSISLSFHLKRSLYCEERTRRRKEYVERNRFCCKLFLVTIYLQIMLVLLLVRCIWKNRTHFPYSLGMDLQPQIYLMPPSVINLNL